MCAKCILTMSYRYHKRHIGQVHMGERSLSCGQEGICLRGVQLNPAEKVKSVAGQKRKAEGLQAGSECHAKVRRNPAAP